MILEELHRISKSSINGAGARYTPGLDPEAPNLEIEDLLAPFHALGHGPELAGKLEELWKEIESTWNSSSRAIDEHAPDAAQSFAHLKATCRRLRNSRPKKSSSLVAALTKACEVQRKVTWDAEAKVRQKEETLAKQEAADQKAKGPHSGGSSDSRTRLQASAQDLAKHARALSHFHEYLDSPAGLLIERNSVVLLGTWGTGKTHFLCDITSHRMARRAPTLLVLTKDFAAGTDALAALCASTRLAADIDELLQSLNRLGAQSGERALLILDGVNESDRAQWRKALRSLRNKVKKFANLGLILSCRRPFEDTLFPKNYSQQYVVLRHRGFTDQEFDAQAEFFRYYGLPLPEVPLLAEEFARPLALKIICEAFTHLPKKAQAKGFESLTSGQRGMTFVLERYVKQQAEEVSRRTGFTAEACWWLLKGGKQAGSTRPGIAPLMAETLREFITTSECLQLIRAHLGTGQKSKAHQVLNALTAAGILVDDVVWRPDEEGGPLEVVRLCKWKEPLLSQVPF